MQGFTEFFLHNIHALKSTAAIWWLLILITIRVWTVHHIDRFLGSLGYGNDFLAFVDLFLRRVRKIRVEFLALVNTIHYPEVTRSSIKGIWLICKSFTSRNIVHSISKRLAELIFPTGDKFNILVLLYVIVWQLRELL